LGERRALMLPIMSFLTGVKAIEPSTSPQCKHLIWDQPI